VTVGGFSLDKYEVTVGRFRQFVQSFDSWRAAGHPTNGEGEGLPNTGWLAIWNARLPADAVALRAALKCDATYQTWSDAVVAVNEARAITCVSWYDAVAFCIWDNGRLPTEAEWEYAAAGGSENRLYPWGSEPSDCSRANVGCAAPVDSVGRRAAGAGRWAHLDLGGNAWEWAFDWYDDAWYAAGAAAGANIVNLSIAPDRVMRGGNFSYPTLVRAVYRSGGDPTTRGGDRGLRCARAL
jgi:formylglycine-generating enzyme required for sulfatase activity